MSASRYRVVQTNINSSPPDFCGILCVSHAIWCSDTGPISMLCISNLLFNNTNIIIIVIITATTYTQEVAGVKITPMSV